MNPRTNSKRFAPGFSLVELLVVVAIMMLLAALAMPRFLDAQKAAYEAGVVSLLRTLQSDQESYRLANGTYADNFSDLGLAANVAPLPADPFAPDSPPRLADLFSRVGAFRVYAAQSDQQPPEQTGGRPKKKTEKVIGGPRGPAGIGPGGPAGGSGGASGGGNPLAKRPGRGGAGAGFPAGGGTPGGATGGQSGGASSGAGPGGFAPPLGGPVTKSNLLIKHNYIFTLRRPTATTWLCTVAPVRDRVNSKFFFMDQSGVIRRELGKPASARSPQMDQPLRTSLR